MLQIVGVIVLDASDYSYSYFWGFLVWSGVLASTTLRSYPGNIVGWVFLGSI